jgi:hypothetical protein
MTTIQISLPDSLHRSLCELAERDSVPLDQFVALAVAEKVSALTTETYIAQRAIRGDAEKFRKALSKVRDVEPESSDRL